MDVKSLALRLLLTVPALGSIPGARAPHGERQPLFAVGQASALTVQFGLGVVALPEPPAFLPTPVAAAPICPIEVRGFISGGEPEETFVVVAVGDNSSLLKVGQGIRTRDGWVAISGIFSERVVVRRGDAAFDCYFGGGALAVESR